MPAYLVADIAVIDPPGIEEYGRRSYPTLLAAGGKLLAAGRPPQVLEGDWQPGLLVLIEFPSAQQAQRWLASPEYQPARRVRQQAATTNLVLLAEDETTSPPP
jgi:uncharacterized protein (DUF1330 family)